jgi:hypothetical protein
MPIRRPFRKELMELPVHFLTATILGTILSFLLAIGTAVALSPFKIRLPELAPIFDPFVWLAGLILGFLMNRFRRHRSACFVGALGMALFFLLMLWEVSLIKYSPGYSARIGGHYWQYEYDHMLSPHNKNPDGEEYLGKFLFGTPALCSVAYSIGAWLALGYPRAKGPRESQGSERTTNA